MLSRNDLGLFDKRVMADRGLEGHDSGVHSEDEPQNLEVALVEALVRRPVDAFELEMVGENEGFDVRPTPSPV